MTQKELLYMEDAINHETSTIGILESNINMLEDEELIKFTNEEIKKHTSIKNRLLKKLGECIDE